MSHQQRRLAFCESRSFTAHRIASHRINANLLLSRLLDLLLEINNSPQIPLERRIDLSLAPASSHSKKLVLPIDEDYDATSQPGMKRLEDLLRTVPHSSYKQAKKALPKIVNELKAPAGETYPADFLTADDIDNYLYEVDMSIDPDQQLPTLAPRARPAVEPQTPNPQTNNNPTSVTNWLRKHAPKVFLQDGEGHGDAEDGESGHAGARKTRGGRGERGGRASTRGKRVSAAARAAADRDSHAETKTDDDPDFGATPVGRGKRKRDEDPGYKPRGSSSRPTKKKRKSEVEATPTSRRTKKDRESAGTSKGH